MVGIVSPWIDADSDNAALRRDSAAALRQELQWAAHLSLQACIRPNVPNSAPESGCYPCEADPTLPSWSCASMPNLLIVKLMTRIEVTVRVVVLRCMRLYSQGPP